jgi:hypothetical protein
MDSVSRDVSLGRILAPNIGGARLRFRLLKVEAKGALEKYAGVCAAQQWQPGYITLTGAELMVFARLKRRFTASWSGGVNGCTWRFSHDQR